MQRSCSCGQGKSVDGVGGKRQQFACHSTRLAIGSQCVAERSYSTRRQPLERLHAGRRDVCKARAPSEKSADDDLIRRIERNRRTAARRQRVVGKRQAGKAREVRCLERQRSERSQVEVRYGPPEAVNKMRRMPAARGERA